MNTLKDILADRIGKRAAAICPTSWGDVLVVADANGTVDLDVQRRCWLDGGQLYVLSDRAMRLTDEWMEAPRPVTPEADRIAKTYGMRVRLCFSRDDRWGRHSLPPSLRPGTDFG